MALDLCRALGLDDQLIANQTTMPSTYVLSNVRLHPMPEGMVLMAPMMILPILRSRLISWPGKLRMGMEIFVRPGRRDYDDSVLLRVFVGGALAEELAEQNEAALIDLARQELREILGITATPVLARAYRWHKSTPQYDVGHRELAAEIDRLVESHPGLHLAGAAYRGSGIPDCIQSGMDTALKITQRHTDA